MLLGQKTPYLDAVPHPWTEAEIRNAISSDFIQARESIEGTAGGLLWRNLNDLWDSHNILRDCIEDLHVEVVAFGYQSSREGFWDHIGRDKEEACSRRIRKQIFCAASAVMGLVDHSRNFSKKYPVEGWESELNRVMGVDGLHRFLQGLRNYCAHWRVASADWLVSRDFVKGSRTVTFVMAREDLLKWDGWHPRAIEFIRSSGSKIDIVSLFAQYEKRVIELYKWHRSHAIKEYVECIRQFLGYRSIHSKINARAYWGLAFQQAKETAELMDYLPRYLTPEQIEHVLSLPFNSKEQVDRVIELIDLHGACDEDLRVRAYAFIKKNDLAHNLDDSHLM